MKVHIIVYIRTHFVHGTTLVNSYLFLFLLFAETFIESRRKKRGMGRHKQHGEKGIKECKKISMLSLSTCVNAANAFSPSLISFQILLHSFPILRKTKVA